MEQEMEKYEENITSIKKEARPGTLENNKAGNAVDSGASVEGLKSDDSAAQEEAELEHGRSVRWPGKLLEHGGSWVGISSPFPPQHTTDPLVKIDPRILSPTSGATTSHHLPPSKISTHPDLSTSEIPDPPSLASFKTPPPPFPSPAFPPRLPVSASNEVSSLFSCLL